MSLNVQRVRKGATQKLAFANEHRCPKPRHRNPTGRLWRARSALRPRIGSINRFESPSPGLRPPSPPPEAGERAGRGGGSWRGHMAVPTACLVSRASKRAHLVQTRRHVRESRRSSALLLLVLLLSAMFPAQAQTSKEYQSRRPFCLTSRSLLSGPP